MKNNVELNENQLEQIKVLNELYYGNDDTVRDDLASIESAKRNIIAIVNSDSYNGEAKEEYILDTLIGFLAQVR